MLQVIEIRAWLRAYLAVCLVCGNQGEFETAISVGNADFIDVSCKCGTYIGRVRDDVGGDKVI